MTAVANLPSFQHNRSSWGSSDGQGGLSTVNGDEVARMFMPRKTVQRANSTSSTSSMSSNSSTSSSGTVSQILPATNGIPMSVGGDNNLHGGVAARKKNLRTGPWPAGKSEAVSAISTARPQSILATNGTSAASSMTSIHQPLSLVSPTLIQSATQQMNARAAAHPAEGNPVLYLLSMNGTFERKTISVPFYPDNIRIGRQTNAKTAPTPINGYFDSKVLSRQHAEIWADRSGKVFIRDIKSSNGTFVNGQRLSAENRESDPHELQTQDHLELGIDIVSEDQKTVVHHKVSAKIEHAGPLGDMSNVMDMNFGDLDPANGAIMLPSQGSIPNRGRAGSQLSTNSARQFGPPSVTGSQMSAMGQQRPMNFWLTPVTTEQIVKRLNQEMRSARVQTNDLGRTDHFFGALLSREEVKHTSKPATDLAKGYQVNGNALPFKSDNKPRFSDPPAPPPQQPLPEKPDIARSNTTDPSSPSLKRTTTERPRSVPNSSPIRQESSSQILNLVEALATAKKEIDAQGARLRDLEEMLQKERQARESAEELAKRLEVQSHEAISSAKQVKSEGSIVEEAFDPPLDTAGPKDSLGPAVSNDTVDATAISKSTKVLEEQLEAMLAEMNELKGEMETFKRRAETAETERDSDRKSLAQMVEQIRADELAKATSQINTPSSEANGHLVPNGTLLKSKLDLLSSTSNTTPHNLELVNGHSVTPQDRAKIAMSSVAKLSQDSPDQALYQTAPYASMLGVVLISMGLMAYLNGWQPPKAGR